MLIETIAFAADVYVAGYEKRSIRTDTGKKVAKYWKNGVGYDLTDGTNAANAASVYVVANNPCVVENLLKEHDPRLNTIRQFRDQMLANNEIGQEIIDLYYENDEMVLELLEKNPATKKFARGILGSIIPLIELSVK